MNSLSRRGDEGSSLVLAIVFLSVVSIVMIALVNWVGNDIRNTANFTAAQSFQSTANSASQIAMQNVRYNFMAQTLNASPPTPCWTTSPTPSLFTLNGQSVDSWCSTSWTTGTDEERDVTISTCLSSVSAASCGQSPLLLAVVSFGDFEKTTGVASCRPVATAVSSLTTTCGTTMTIITWAFGVNPPSVTSASAGSTSCTSGSPVQIVGANLTEASSITFVMTSGISTNIVYSASSFTVVNSTLITACTPLSGSGTAYVVVTTPYGPSSFGPTFSY